jgi:hypothetical protein
VHSRDYFSASGSSRLNGGNAAEIKEEKKEGVVDPK